MAKQKHPPLIQDSVISSLLMWQPTSRVNTHKMTLFPPKWLTDFHQDVVESTCANNNNTHWPASVWTTTTNKKSRHVYDNGSLPREHFDWLSVIVYNVFIGGSSCHSTIVWLNRTNPDLRPAAPWMWATCVTCRLCSIFPLHICGRWGNRQKKVDTRGTSTCQARLYTGIKYQMVI